MRLYLFTRGPSAGVNVVDGSFDNIVVGGKAWWNPTYGFNAGPVGSARGVSIRGGISGQLYGPASPDKVAPYASERWVRLSTVHRCRRRAAKRHRDMGGKAVSGRDPKPLPAHARDPITMGEIAYKAYRETSDGKSLVSGGPMIQFPLWRYLPDDVRAAWNAAGNAAAAQGRANAK